MSGHREKMLGAGGRSFSLRRRYAPRQRQPAAMPESKRITSCLRAIGEVVYIIDVSAEPSGCYTATWNCMTCRESGIASRVATSPADAIDRCVEEAQRHHTETHA